MSVHLRKSSQSTRILIPSSPAPAPGRRSTSGKYPRRQGRAKSRLRIAILLCVVCTGLFLWTTRRRIDVPSLPTLKRAGGEPINRGKKEAVHRVERSVLETLRLLEIELNGQEIDHEEQRYREGDVNSEGAPPAVDFLPELGKGKNTHLIPAYELDRRTCGGTCQFLVPAWLGEQETKAQSHLYQLGLLAVALNRTLVLPNVIRSRLGACFGNPFTFYYAADSLSRLGIPTILQADFLTWAATRDPPPTAQVVSMLGARPEYPQGAVAYDAEGDPSLVPTKPERKLCLSPPRAWLDFTAHSPLSLFPPEAWHKLKSSQLDYGKRVFGTLLSTEIAGKTSRTPEPDVYLPNVLAFNYELRYPILDVKRLRDLMVEAQTPDDGFASQAQEYELHDEVNAVVSRITEFEHFPYAAAWTTQAIEMAESLSPFIAIHWRQETLPTAILSTCANQLAKMLMELSIQHPDIRTIYLATDYPLDGKAHSGTFTKLITEHHHKAMSQLLQNLPPNMRLTSFSKEAEEAPEDSGLLGIIDKTVAMHADVFVTGFSGSFQYDPSACGKESSFTRQIIQARKARQVAAADSLRNVVDLWDVDGRRMQDDP